MRLDVIECTHHFYQYIACITYQGFKIKLFENQQMIDLFLWARQINQSILFNIKTTLIVIEQELKLKWNSKNSNVLGVFNLKWL